MQQLKPIALEHFDMTATIRAFLILIACCCSAALAQTSKPADAKTALEAAKASCLAKLAATPEYKAAKDALAQAEAKQAAIQKEEASAQDRLDAATATSRARTALKAMEDKAIKSDEAVAAAEKAAGASSPVGQPGRVVFIIDAGGAMLPIFSDARTQVAKTVSNLPEDTLFGVIVCGDPAPQFFTPALMPAKIENKKKLDIYMDKIAAKGDANRIVAAKAALSLRPDAVWLITTASWCDAAKAKELVTIYKASHIKLNTTVAFFEGMPATSETTKQIETLWNLAHETGGQCVLASGEPLKSIDDMPKPVAKPVKTGGSIFDTK